MARSAWLRQLFPPPIQPPNCTGLVQMLDRLAVLQEEESVIVDPAFAHQLRTELQMAREDRQRMSYAWRITKRVEFV